jgi:hypothetical protein
MSREAVRTMKRAIAAANDAGTESRMTIGREAAISLLERSVAYGHGRLAVIRLAMAADVGAAIPPNHWAYCEAVVAEIRDSQLQDLLHRAHQSLTHLPHLENCE